MKKVRFGIIGIGNMGKVHATQMGPIKEIELTAVADVDAKTAAGAGESHGVPFFTDYRELIDSGLVDAVLIATPHYDHPGIGIYAFKKGLHVLCEKPLAVTIGAADKLIQAAKKSRRKFGVMLQQRRYPPYRAAKKIIDSGRLGKIYRVSMVCPWFRNQAYYDSGSWRATWVGEGGGILINQLPHNLDIINWLLGAPEQVQGWVKTRHHKIEVEDEAYAVLEYANGANGYIYASTFEAPGSDRMEICGEKGKLLIEGWSVRYWTLSQALPEFIRKSKLAWANPTAKEIKVKLPKAGKGHADITRNFALAILKNEKLIAPGAEGIRSLELGNAILLSGMENRPVKLPLKRAEVERLLTRLRHKSKKKR